MGQLYCFGNWNLLLVKIPSWIYCFFITVTTNEKIAINATESKVKKLCYIS